MTENMQLVEPSLPTMEKVNNRRRKSFWRKSLFVLMVLLFIALLGFGGLVWKLGSFSGTAKLMGLAFNYCTDRVQGKPPFQGKRQVNILLIGMDVSFVGAKDARTDTLKLMHIDLDKATVSLLSIPRDTWIDIPGTRHRTGRINSVYQLGGDNEQDRVNLVKTAVQNLLSEYGSEPIQIDHYVRIQPGGFIKIVDALGGIDINVEKKMDYEDPSQNLFIHLPPGNQPPGLYHLNGTEAMGYVRFRHDAEGDYGRIRRQDIFIRKLVADLKDPQQKRRFAAMGPLLEMTVTDLSAIDALAVKNLLAKVGLDGIQTAQLPTVPTFKGAASVVEVQDTEEAGRVIRECFHGPRPTIAIINGTKHGGVAHDVTDLINLDEYNIVQVATTKDPVAKTTIFTNKKFTSIANQFASELKMPVPIETAVQPPAAESDMTTTSTNPAKITLVIGADYSVWVKQAKLPVAHYRE